MAEYLCEEDMNTGEYISRDLALKQLNATCLATDCDNYNGVRCRACAYADAMDFIDAIPAADVQPIKHGRWYHNTSKYISELDAYFIQACCSCCGRYSDRVDSYSQLMSNEHCSHCGARMKGKVRNLTDEETAIYESWIDSEAKDTGVNIMGGGAE